MPTTAIGSCSRSSASVSRRRASVRSPTTRFRYSRSRSSLVIACPSSTRSQVVANVGAGVGAVVGAGRPELVVRAGRSEPPVGGAGCRGRSSELVVDEVEEILVGDRREGDRCEAAAAGEFGCERVVGPVGPAAGREARGGGAVAEPAQGRPQQRLGTGPLLRAHRGGAVEQGGEGGVEGVPGAVVR